jgi:hypothetical protein
MDINDNLIEQGATIPFPLSPHEPTKNESKGNEERQYIAQTPDGYK